MTDKAAIAANYSDFKLVKSRSVAQIVLEIPIEQAETFIAAFGMPLPGKERPVALALLKSAEPKQEKAKVPFNQMSRAQQAGILCADKQFQKWLSVSNEPDPEEAAKEDVYRTCKVQSRTMLDHIAWSGQAWDALVSRYRIATGQQAEPR